MSKKEKERKIRDILEAYEEDFDSCIWYVQGTPVIYHDALERIAAKEKISFDPPVILRAERDEAAILVSARLGDRMEWTIGEALLGANYRVSGKQQPYVWAMAEKRGKDRVILKLINLHGLLYSEEEADEFSRHHAKTQEQPPQEQPRATVDAANDPDSDPQSELKDLMQRLKDGIDAQPSMVALTRYMKHEKVMSALLRLPEGWRRDVRGYAVERLESLGWVPSHKVGLSPEEVS